MKDHFGYLEAYTEKRVIDLDKILKFADHLTDEIHNDVKSAQFYRGEEFLRNLIVCLRINKSISPEDYNMLKREEIEVSLFLLIEKLIEKGFFISSSTEIEESSYSISVSYAMHMYRKLGKVLSRPLKDFSYLNSTTAIKLLTYSPENDSELEEITLQVIHNLVTGKYQYDSRCATELDDF